MTRRERVLSAIRREPVDRVPCSPFFNPLSPQQRVGYRYQFPWGPSEGERIDYCVEELDLEPVVHAPIGGHYPESSVTSRVQYLEGAISKTWSTPAGDITAKVRCDEKWPHGLDIPFFSDFNISAFDEPWVQSENDVACLEHILLPPTANESIQRLEFNCGQAKTIADRHGLALMASIGSGLTGMQQLCGPENLCLMTVDDPALVERYLELEHRLSVAYIKIATGLGVDIIRRNGFYETSDLYSPQMLHTFLAGRLNEEFDTAHRGGALTGYTVHTGIMPILDHLAELDVDCIMHVDTAFRGVDLPAVYTALGERKSFWLGPSNTFHMWSDDPGVVCKAVANVLEVFGKQGTLVTACPSAHSIMPWKNTLAMIEECRKLGEPT